MKPLRALPWLFAAWTLSAALLCACDRPTPPAAPAPPTAAKPAADAEIFVVFEQRSGVIRARLATELAPRICMSFINLVERGYFDGRPWDEFSSVVRQSGETYSMYTLPHEFSPKLLFDRPGLLCVSNTTNDASARAKPTRIFITIKEQDRWNLVYAPFGRGREDRPRHDRGRRIGAPEAIRAGARRVEPPNRPGLGGRRPLISSATRRA